MSDFIIENGVLERYTGKEEIVTIPEGVTSIGESVFSWCSSLREIRIPEGVTSIGESAFSGCRSLSKRHTGRRSLFRKCNTGK